MTNSNQSLRLGLPENACHSLQRGYEMWNRGRRKKDGLALKEAIIWIHHGVELSLKQLLVQTNEFLVFDNVDESVRKLAHLRRQPGTDKATVLDLFEHGEGVYTVGFKKLVERVSVMFDLEELAQGSSLRERIDELTIYRNKIVHFAVEVQIDEVTSLLAELMEPFLELLEREINDENFVQRCIPYVRASGESTHAVYRLRYSETEKRIVSLLKKFNGQEVPGELFSLDGTLILPHFAKIEREPSQNVPFDILAENDLGEKWLIEIKLTGPNMNQVRDIEFRLIQYITQSRQNFDEEITLWLVSMGTGQSSRRYPQPCFDSNLWVSSVSHIKQLERIIG